MTPEQPDGHPVPEQTARNQDTPPTGGAQTDPAAGHRTPALRDAIAAALLARIKQATISGPQPFGLDAVTHLLAPTEYDLADIALAVVAPRLATPVETDAAVLAGVEQRLAAARATSCGHDVTTHCDTCAPGEAALRTELAAAYLELQLAIGHDRQPYPTADAYTAVCAALEQHRGRADKAEADRAEAETAITTAVRARKAAEGRARRAEEDARTLRQQLVHPSTEQPVSTPQPPDDSDADACRIVHVDGGPVRVHGAGPMSPQSAAHFAEVIRAARLRYQAEHPEHQDDTTPHATEQPAAVTVPPSWPPSTLFRRLVNGLSGAVYDRSGRPICTCTVGRRCANCQAADGQDGG